MRLLLDYDRTRLIKDGIVGQTMHGLALAWHYFPHAWGVCCGGRLSPRDTFADSGRLENALSRRRKYGALKSESDLRKALRTVSGTQAVSNFRPSAAAALFDRYMSEGDGLRGICLLGTVGEYWERLRQAGCGSTLAPTRLR